MSQHTGTHETRNRQQYAEEAFEDTWAHWYGQWTREGWADPSWKDGEKVKGALHGLTSSMPDYFARRNDGELFHVEVKGGIDTFTSINHRWDRTVEWARFLPEQTIGFMYNMSRGEYLLIDAIVLGKANDDRVQHEYHDGGFYYMWTWHDLSELAEEKGEVRSHV